MSNNEVVISPGRGIEQGLLERLRTTGSLSITWTTRDLRVRYRQSVLRSWWSLLQPIVILVTYGWVFTAVLNVSGDDAPYLTFAWAGLVPFTFFSQSLSTGVGSIQQAAPIISRIYFPREVLPLSVVGGSLVDLAVMLATLVLLSWVQVGPPTVHLAGLVPTLLVLVVWTTAATTGAAALTVFRRDLHFAVPLVLRALFIATPVMYPVALLSDAAPWAVDLNPLTVVIESTRDAIYRASWPDWSVLGAQLGVGLLLLAAVYATFLRLEPRMSDYV